MTRAYHIILYFFISAAILLSCSKKSKPTSDDPDAESSATGSKYDGEETFELSEFKNQPICPGLVYIEGGKATLGVIQE
ncbi:MAG TPA: hypothetical protein VL947_10795, partial [Cytophagales bacterium]|nr:hypothetical protein [Cytophagales bacterium]